MANYEWKQYESESLAITGPRSGAYFSLANQDKEGLRHLSGFVSFFIFFSLSVSLSWQKQKIPTYVLDGESIFITVKVKKRTGKNHFFVSVTTEPYGSEEV